MANSTAEELTVTLATEFYDESEKIYLMANNPRGYCVIFNNYKGKDETVFPERHGSERECESLNSVFNQLHFKVKVHKNRSAKQIDVICSELSQNDELVKHNALVLIILSHGGNGCVSGVDGKRVKLETLFAYFTTDKCESLANKPKVFFVSACRGTNLDTIKNFVPKTDAGRDAQNIPRAAWSDMLIVYSATPGYVSFRDPITGTWLGSILARALANHAYEEPLRDILDIVKREISQMCTTQVSNGELALCMQAPNIDDRGFKKKLYFNPGLIKET